MKLQKDTIRFKLLANRLFGRFLIKKNLSKLLQYRFRYEGTIGDVISAHLDRYLDESEKYNQDLRYKLTIDMVQCYYRYRAHPNEYFLFGFRDMPARRRAQFLTNRYKDYVMASLLGDENRLQFLDDKWKFYSFFKDYFKRDVARVLQESDLDEFIKFWKNHNKFIVKPIAGQCGQGVRLIERNAYGSALQCFRELLLVGGCVVEELIRQDKYMEGWNSSSVNTVRYPSFLARGGYNVLKPVIRMGRLGAIVDNAASGGIFATIDDMTGCIVTDAVDEFGHRYKEHPDSKQKFIGSQIPKWDELQKLAREIHFKIPNQPYVGWDFALTEQGWVLIEGNWGQFLSEFADNEGIKEKFNSYIGVE